MSSSDSHTSRDQHLRRGMTASLAFRVTSAIAPIATVPVALHVLGRDTFGLWTAVTAMTSVLAFADLGLGNGLMTELSTLRGRDASPRKISRVIGASYGLVIAIAAVLLAGCLAVCWAVPWPVLMHAHDQNEARYVASVCLFTFLANVPASLVIRVMFAFQKSGSSYLWQCLGPALSLTGAYFAYWLHFDVPVFLLFATGGPLVANILTTIFWYGREPGAYLRFRIPDVAEARALLSVGGMFLTISVLLGIATNLDLMLIPSFAGTGAAADYSVPWRVYSQLGMLLSLLSVPFWSAAGEALARGEVEWVQRRARSLGKLNILVMFPCAALGLALGPSLLHLWVGTQVHPSRVLLAGFGIWWCVMALMYPMFMVQNGAGVLRHQVIGWAAFTALSIVVKVALSRTGHWHLLPLAAAAIYVVTVAPAGVAGYRAALASAKTRCRVSV